MTMNSLSLSKALERLDIETENLYEAEIHGERSGAKLALLGMRVRAAELAVEEIKRIETTNAR